MIRRLLQFAIEQRLLMVFFVIALALLGVWNFARLPIDAVPDITNKQVQINTAVTGLSPVEIEKQITFPVEWAMQGVPGVEQVRSMSFYGVSQVTVVFSDEVDLYRARQLVSERLAEAKESLPPNIGSPFLGPIWTGLGEIYFWSVEAIGPKSDGLPYTPTDLRTIQDWIIKPQLRGLPGITEINAIGGFEKQYHVLPNPHKLVAYRVTLQDLLKALAENNANVGGGYIEHNGEQYTIRSIAQVKTIEDIEGIKLGVYDGIPFFVRDVAQVEIGGELRTGGGTVNGKEGVVGTAILLYGENSRVVARRVDDKLKQINKTLPENVRAVTLYNREYLVDGTLETVRKNLGEGALFVIAVLFLLLGNVRAALIVALAIPLSMLLAVTGMVQNRISANLMSLGAIDFGIIVDGAVVMVENIVRRLSSRQQAEGRVLDRSERCHVVYEAAVEVAKPTIFGVAIIMIVYLPILSLGGIEGKMFRPMAEVVLLALSASLLLTFTVIPALAVLLLRGRIAEKESIFTAIAKRVYAPILRLALRFKVLVVAGALGALGAAALLSLNLGSEFVPKLSEGALALQPTRMPSISLSSSLEMQQKVEQTLLQQFPDEIETIFARTGTSEIVTDVCGPEISDSYITLKPQENWTKATTLPELTEAMETVLHEIPGQNYEFSQPIELRMNELISGVRSDLAVKIYGEDMEEMLEIARRVEAALEDISGAEDIKVEQPAGMPIVAIEVDRAALARYGLNASDVQDVVAIALGGSSAGLVLDGDRRFDLVVRLPEATRSDIQAIGALPVPLPQFGEQDGVELRTIAGTDLPPSPGYIPLSSVAKISIVEGARQIRREDGKRRVVVTANVRGRDLGSFVAEAQERVEAELGRLPEGYWLGWGGQFEHLIAAKERLRIVVPLALGLVFILLFATFGTLRDSLLVFTGVPFALVGGVIALWFRDIPFSISAAVGFIALSGVAVLNGLVLMTFINQLRSEGRGIDDAVIEGCLVRLRPVLMTALVAALGFVPMAVATGMGAEVQRPLATVVIGGVISSTLLTLVVLPVLYRLVNRAD